MPLHLCPGRKHLEEIWRLKAPESYIYVIKADGDRPIKVGFAKDVTQRMAEVQTGNARPLELLYAIPGDRELEWQLHGVAETMMTRMVGEWFSGERLAEFLRFVGQVEDAMIAAADVGDAFGWRNHFPADHLRSRPSKLRLEPDVKVSHVEPSPRMGKEEAERLREHARLSRFVLDSQAGRDAA